MTHRILPPTVERFETHAAVCRARRQNLACSTCSELAECAAAIAHRWGACRDCGAEDWLIGGRCEPCRTSEAA